MEVFEFTDRAVKVMSIIQAVGFLMIVITTWLSFRDMRRTHRGLKVIESESQRFQDFTDAAITLKLKALHEKYPSEAEVLAKKFERPMA